MLRPILRGTLAYVGYTVLAPFVAWHVPYISDEARRDFLLGYEQRLQGCWMSSPWCFRHWPSLMRRCTHSVEPFTVQRREQARQRLRLLPIGQSALLCARRRSTAPRNNCSVLFQPRQPSVTDTPYFIDALNGWQPSNK